MLTLPLPASRALGAGFCLHNAPAGAAPRVLCARFRLALHRFRKQTPPVARRYATVHPAAEDGELEDILHWDMVSRQKEEGVGDEEESASRPLGNTHREKDEAFYNYVRHTLSFREEIENLRRLLSRKGERRDLPPAEDVVGWLFEAIRAGDPWRAYLFLINATSEEQLVRLVNLPATEFTELLECLDPLRVHDRVDLLANLRCTAPMLRFNFRSYLINKYGVRRIYGSVLDVLGPVVEARVLGTPAGTPPAVFAILLRLAGAACLPRLAYRIRELAMHAMNSRSDSPYETSDSGAFMLDYLRTLFLTEPLYYQHDKTRVRVRPQAMPQGVTWLRHAQRKKLQMMTLQHRSEKLDYYGVDPDVEHHDIHRFTGSHVRMRDALSLPRLFAMRPSEDLICAAFMASTSSGTTDHIRKLLYMFYGIMTRVDEKTGELTIFGGRDVPSPPTEKVLMAVTRALGISGEIKLAMRVLLFMARRYRVEVPPEVWSEYIEWAQVHGSRPAMQEWEIAEDSRMIRAVTEVPALVRALEEEGGSFAPTAFNLLTLAANHIYSKELTEALGPIRRAKAHLEEMEAQLEKAAVAAAAAQAQDVAMPSYASRDMALHHLAMRRELVLDRLRNTARLWIQRAGELARYRKLRARDLRPAEAMVPDFVREFWAVLPQNIAYDTSTGSISIRTGVVASPWRSYQKVFRGPEARVRGSVRVLLDPEDDPENYRDMESWRAGQLGEGDGPVEGVGGGGASFEGVDGRDMEAERAEAERAEAERLNSQSAVETTSFDRLVARTMGDQGDVESLIAQNMGGARAEAENTRSDKADPELPTDYYSKAVARGVPPDAAAYRARQNEGRGTVWEWARETTIVRPHSVARVQRPVRRRQRGRAAAFEAGRGVVYVWGGELRLDGGRAGRARVEGDARADSEDAWEFEKGNWSGDEADRRDDGDF